jgi:hypothetical protein
MKNTISLVTSIKKCYASSFLSNTLTTNVQHLTVLTMAKESLQPETRDTSALERNDS